MARITELTLRDVRCFGEAQTARLGRITLLVGDNSTGKSTFLGCYKAFATLTAMWELEDRNYFDVSPFRMGAFETIVRSGATGFCVGGRFDGHCHTGAQFLFERAEDGSPLERRVDLEYAAGTGRSFQVLEVTRIPGASPVWRFRGPGFAWQVERSEISYSGISTWLSRSARHGHLPFGGEPARFRKRRGKTASAAEQAEFAKFASFFRSALPLPGNQPFTAIAVDPELPRRRREYPSAPRYVARTDADSMTFLRNAGRELRLWDEVTVEPAEAGHGARVIVHRAGQKHNLVDVGYGVHSLLPLIRTLYEHRDRSDAILLVQQPEIHVHPSAQARFAELLARSTCGFVIETHSQHLIDRFRICRMKGILRPEELSIVYFEPNGDGAARIHNIAVDSEANLVNAPGSYGSFFLTETEQLLGLGE